MNFNRMVETQTLPQIIQGGMGFGISVPSLAQTVSVYGQLGTVTGVGLDILLARILQNGDPCGHYRRALAHFPFQQIAQEVLEAFYVEDGIPKGTKYKGKPVFTVSPSKLLISLTICANYAFVFLAKEGHDNPISINYMEKIGMPQMYATLGAMFARVDFITVGAGIPRQIPDLIDSIAEGRTLQYIVPFTSLDGTMKSYTMSFDPKKFFGDEIPLMKKPGFIPIVASNALATSFATKFEGRVFGLIIEEPTAGGHNAPPRTLITNADGKSELIYGEKDKVDYSKIATLGLPFWIGGSCASPEKLGWAISLGATGVQVGSIFALSEESGMDPEIRRKVRELGFKGELKVGADMRISPTNYPLELAELEGTIVDPAVLEKRARVCNQSALVSLFEKSDGSIGYRCAAEPVDKYTSKGGKIEDTVGRGCICNGLMVTAGLGNKGEFAVVTLGQDLGFLPRLMARANSSYGAKQAIDFLLGIVRR